MHGYVSMLSYDGDHDTYYPCIYAYAAYCTRPHDVSGLTGVTRCMVSHYSMLCVSMTAPLLTRKVIGVYSFNRERTKVRVGAAFGALLGFD